MVLHLKQYAILAGCFILMLSACTKQTESPDSLYNQAVELSENGDFKEAIAYFSKAVKRDPNFALAYAGRANSHSALSQWSEALVDLDYALALESGNVDFLSNRAQVYMQFNRTKEAIEDLNRAISINPHSIAARYNRGTILFQLNKYKQALEDFNVCIKIDPHAIASYFNRAMTYVAMNDIERSKSDMDYFIKHSKNPAWIKIAKDSLKKLGK